jgi:hypothetical protein
VYKEKRVATQRSFFPLYGFVGLALCLLAWACSWLRIAPFYSYSFFPQWFGYILFMDALVVSRKGTSLLSRMGKGFLLLFVLSSPLWWLFEFFNIPVQNWHYILDRPYSPLAYVVLTSISFSTVLPAVMETVELLASFKPLHPHLSIHEPGPRLSLPVFFLLELIGVFCLILPWLFPHYCFGLIWLSLVFLLDPLNNLLGRKSAVAHIMMGDWRFIVMPLGTLWCGFFWEMWNFFALPKWYYTVPYIGFWKIFEMPVLGYTGYLPFGLELFALYQFVLFLLRWRKDYLAI